MDFCYQEIEKNLGKMYDPEIGKSVHLAMEQLQQLEIQNTLLVSRWKMEWKFLYMLD